MLEKEAFPLVVAGYKFGYLLIREDTVRVVTDHRNLKFLLDPLSVRPDLKQYVVDKVARWRLRSNITSIRYVIEVIKGHDNDPADMVTRWASPAAFPTNVYVVSPLPRSIVYPHEHADYRPPSDVAVAESQNFASQPLLRSKSEVAFFYEMKMDFSRTRTAFYSFLMMTVHSSSVF
jgi:hypothetical protein